MEMAGKQMVDASLARTWEALNDPAILRECIKGCTAFESSGDNRFDVKMVVAIGPMKVKFGGSIALAEIEPLAGYVIHAAAEGLGGVGFGTGVIRVRLGQPAAGGTEVNYTVNANVGGKIAQLGSRLIQGVAMKMTGEFFAAFNAQLAAAAPAE